MTERSAVSKQGLDQPWPELGGLFFTARHLTEGIWAGRHASATLGGGLDFYDYRPYTPGDAIQDVDWKLYGRTDRLYIRRYRRMTELPLYLLVDRSASMAFSGVDAQGIPLQNSGRGLSKWEWARLLASALAFLTVRQADQVALGLAGQALDGFIRPAGSWTQLKRVISSLERAKFDSAPGRLPVALEAFHRALPRRGLLVVISDFLDEVEPVLEALWRYRHSGYEVVLFQTLTRQEIDLEAMAGDGFELIDLESSTSARIRPDQVAEAYGRLITDHIAKLHDGCTPHGIDHLVALTDQSVAGVLRYYLLHQRSALSR